MITLLIIALAFTALVVTTIASAATILLPMIDVAIAVLVIYGLYKLFSI